MTSSDGNLPGQTQEQQPGHQSAMQPQPLSIRENYRGSGRLAGKAALISGGDSGIGRSVAVHFAREGADVAIVHLQEDEDAAETRRLIEAEGRKALIIRTDLREPAHAEDAVRQTVEAFGRLDVLVNNVAEQHEVDAPEDIDPERLQRTFQTNVFSYIYLSEAALAHLPEGGAIINTGSVNGIKGNDTLIGYASTKGAIQALTFSLASRLVERGIRVNAVAPGPVWTPLIPASLPQEKVEGFGRNNPMKRPAQPSEIGPAYVFLACEDASYITGQIVHVNGGMQKLP